MIRLIFENDLGQLTFAGGGRAAWRVTELSGLGLPPRTPQVLRYAGQAGQTTTDLVDDPRVITLAGDTTERSAWALGQAVRILSKPGRLTVAHGDRVRCIDAYVTALELSAGHGEYRCFTLEFTCDNPYFRDNQACRTALFSRRDLISGSFTLPCVFTERTTRAVILNRGDAVSFPVVVVSCQQEGTTTGGFGLENHTTGQSFLLDYTLALGEMITIDFATRRIFSNQQREDNHNGNLLYFLPQNVFLSDFFLTRGANDVEATNYTPDSNISIVCTHNNQYLEAVV